MSYRRQHYDMLIASARPSHAPSVVSQFAVPAEFNHHLHVWISQTQTLPAPGTDACSVGRDVNRQISLHKR